MVAPDSGAKPYTFDPDRPRAISRSTIAAPSSVQEKKYRDEAEVLMSHIETKNLENKAINLVLEFAVGKVQQVIDDMVRLTRQNHEAS